MKQTLLNLKSMASRAINDSVMRSTDISAIKDVEITPSQRRDVFRVSLPAYDRRTVTLQHKSSDAEFSGQIVDISIKGFCVELPAIHVDFMPLGERFRYLDMELPDQRMTLSGDAVLVNLRPSGKPDALSAGFAITNRDPYAERALMRAALYYQRSAISWRV